MILTATYPETDSRDSIIPRDTGRPARLLRWLAAAALAAAGPASAAPPAGSPVQGRLNDTVVSMALDAVIFSKVIDQLRTEHNLNIYVNERALAAAGVGRDTRVTVELREVPLATAFELILRDAGGETARLTYVVENEVVVISTGAESGERPVTRIYDVTDLIDSGYARRRLLNTPLLSLRVGGGEGRGAEADGSESAAQNPFQGGATAEERSLTFERLESLMELIRDTVDPDGWRDQGGKHNTLNRQGNRFIVLAGLQVHQQIEVLLSLLREQASPVVDLRWTLFHVEPKDLAGLRAIAGDDWPRVSLEAAATIAKEHAGEDAALLQTTTTGPSGRGQIVSSLRQADYIATAIPVVDESAVAYQPAIAQANSGIEFIVLPCVGHDGRTVSLDVSLALASPVELGGQRCVSTTATRESEKISHDVAVQLRAAGLRTVLSTVRLEIDQAILLEIPSLELASGHPTDEHLFLMLAPRVH